MATVVQHPLAGHLLSILRDTLTEPAQFRLTCQQLTTILVLEATRNMPTVEKAIQTPLEATYCKVLGQDLAAVPILRAGLGMLPAVVDLFPRVSVGTIGLERDETSAQASQYHCKLPRLENRYVLCLDPMLATGGSASQAITMLKAKGASKIRMVSIVAAPEGVEALETAHPDVEIFTASVDRELNQKKYILPGLGDFGDRLYGTL